MVALRPGPETQAPVWPGISRARPFPPIKLKDISMNKDQVKGTVKDIAGKMQEKTGQALGNTSQQVKGVVKQAEGQSQKAKGDAKEVLKDAVDKL